MDDGCVSRRSPLGGDWEPAAGAAAGAVGTRVGAPIHTTQSLRLGDTPISKFSPTNSDHTGSGDLGFEMILLYYYLCYFTLL